MARQDFYDDPAAPKPNNIVPSVTAVVLQQNQLLLVHKIDNNYWALPGGAIDIGESSSQATVREVREESGIEITIIGLVGIYTDPRHVMRYDDGEVRQQFSLCFRAQPMGAKLKTQPSETKDVKWVPIEEIGSLTIHPSMRTRINDGLQWHEGDQAHVA